MAFQDLYENDFYVLAYDEDRKYYLEFDEKDKKIIVCYLFVNSSEASEYANWINKITGGKKIGVYRGNNLEGTVINIYDATSQLENKFLRVLEANGITTTEDDRKKPLTRPILFTDKGKAN